MISTRSSREERKNNEFRRVFFWQLKSNRVGMIFYTAALVIFIPLMLMLESYSEYDLYMNPNNWEATDTMDTALSNFAQYMTVELNSHLVLILLPIVLCFVVGWCISAFGFMHGRRSVDLFHALPIRRRPLLLGSYAAGLVFLYVPMVLCFALCQAIGFYYNLPAPYSAAFIWQSFLITVLMVTAVYTSSMFFCICSGTLLDAAISILALNLGWPILIACIRDILIRSLPGYNYGISAELATAFAPYLAAFVPMGRLPQVFFNVVMEESYSKITGAYDISPLFVLWWVALTALFLLGSLIYYTRRKSECAEDHFSFPVIRGILRFLISAAAGLGFGLILGSILDSNTAFFIGIVTGAFAAHLVGQLIWTHTLRKFWKTLPAYALLLCCTAGFMFLVSQGGLGYVTRLPNAEDVVSVDSFSPTEVVDDSVESFFKDSAYIEPIGEGDEYFQTLTPVFTESSDIQRVIDYHKSLTQFYHGPYLPFEKDPTYYATSFFYQLKNGQTMTRRYNLNLSENTTDITKAESEIIKLDAYTKYNLFYLQKAKHISSLDVYLGHEGAEYDASAYGSSELTDEQKETLWNTLMEELSSPNFSIPVTYVDPSELEVAPDSSSLLTEINDMLPATEAEPAYDDDPVLLRKPKLPDEVPETRAEAEAYFDGDNNYLSYCISLDSFPFAELSQEMQDMIRSQLDDPEADIEYVQSNGYINVPECCTKTRDLIYEYTRENGSFYSYDEED